MHSTHFIYDYIASDNHVWCHNKCVVKHFHPSILPLIIVFVFILFVPITVIVFTETHPRRVQDPHLLFQPTLGKSCSSPVLARSPTMRNCVWFTGRLCLQNQGLGLINLARKDTHGRCLHFMLFLGGRVSVSKTQTLLLRQTAFCWPCWAMTKHWKQ